MPTQGTSPERYNEQVFIGENPWKMLQSPSVSDIHVGIGVILLWRWRRATASAHETYPYYKQRTQLNRQDNDIVDVLIII